MFFKLLIYYWRDAWNVRTLAFLATLLLITVILAAGLPAARIDEKSIFEPVDLSVVDEDNSIISYTVIDQFRSLDVVGTVYIESLEQALGRLERDETLLTLLIPAGFYEQTRQGLDQSGMTVYFNDKMPVEAMVFRRMLNHAADSIVGIQSALYAYQDAIIPLYDHADDVWIQAEAASVDLAFKLVARKSILDIRETTQLNEVDFVISALSTLFAAITSLLVLMHIRYERQTGLHERLLTANVSLPALAGARQLIWLLWLSAGLVPLLAVLSSFYPDIHFVTLYTTLVLAGLAFSGWMMVFAYKTQLHESHLLAAWLLTLALLLLGGCIYPHALLPDILQKASVLSPARWSFLLVYNSLSGQTVHHEQLVILLLHVGVSQAAALAVMKKAVPLQV